MAMAAGRSMQIGFESKAQTHTVYGRNEPAMIHYHSSMRKVLREPEPAVGFMING